jgi:hypothetical protein
LDDIADGSFPIITFSVTQKGAKEVSKVSEDKVQNNVDVKIDNNKTASHDNLENIV